MKRIIPGITSLLVAGIAVACYLDAGIPRATAILQIHPSIIASTASGMMAQGYMESEFETITSPETLATAADTLNLNSDEAALLKEKVTTTAIRGTDFLKITVKHRNADQAIEIANAVAEAYVKRRVEAEESRAEKTIEALDNELLAQDKLVQKHLSELRQIIEANKIKFEENDPSRPIYPADNNTNVLQLYLKKSNFDQAQEQYEQASAMLREMKIKQQEARVLLKIPREPVTVYERAKLLIN